MLYRQCAPNDMLVSEIKRIGHPPAIWLRKLNALRSAQRAAVLQQPEDCAPTMSVAKSEQHSDLSGADRTKNILSMAGQQVRDPGGQTYAQDTSDATRSCLIVQGFQGSEHRVSRGYIDEMCALPNARLGDLPIAYIDTGNDHTCVLDRIIEHDSFADIELAR